MNAVFNAIDRAAEEKSLQFLGAERSDTVLRAYSLLMVAGDEKQLEQMHKRQPEAILLAARLALALHDSESEKNGG